MEKKQSRGTITIGVFGLHPYVGVTHTVMLLAEYLSHLRRKKTAVLELSGKCDLERYERLWYGANGMEQIFWRKRCAYWKEASDIVLQEEYRNAFCILDLGSDLDKNAEHLLACQRKLIVGDCGIVHSKDWQHFVLQPRIAKQLSLEDRDSWTLLLNHGKTGRKGSAFEKTESGKNVIRTLELGTEALFPLSRRVADLFKKVV